MNYVPAVQVALILGGLGLLGLVAANGKNAWRWTPVLLIGFVGVAFAYRALDPAFVLESLLLDPPWGMAAALAAFAALAGAGSIRVNAWPAVVLGTALCGDTVIAAGLALAEPDDRRRARLVIASSGASLLSPWSGAAVLTLGNGPFALTLLGVALAFVGFTPGGSRPALHPPDVRGALTAASVPLWMALLTWVFMLGGVSDFAAMGLEGLPPVVPGHATAWLGTVAVIFGALGFEPGVALFAQDVVIHASQVRGPWMADALRVGISVGGGLPLLLATGSRLTTGLPLWVAQVLVAILFLYVRYGV